MPQRTGRTVTVTGGPQGDDAYVVIKRMTVDEQAAFGKLFANVQGQSTEEQEVAVRSAVAEIVMDWNFVGDDDLPLPKPHGNVEAVGALLAVELKWLFEAITGSADDQKKDLKPLPTT